MTRILNIAIYIVLLAVSYFFYGWAATMIVACLLANIVELRQTARAAGAEMVYLNRMINHQMALNVESLKVITSLKNIVDSITSSNIEREREPKQELKSEPESEQNRKETRSGTDSGA